MSKFFKSESFYLPFGLEDLVSDENTVTSYSKDSESSSSCTVIDQVASQFHYRFEAEFLLYEGIQVHDATGDYLVNIVLRNKIQTMERQLVVASNRMANLNPFYRHPLALEEIFFAPQGCGFLLSDGLVIVPDQEGSEKYPVYKSILLEDSSGVMGYHFNYSDLFDKDSMRLMSHPPVMNAGHMNHPMDFFVQWDKKTDTYICQMQTFHGVAAIVAFLTKAIAYVVSIHKGETLPYMNEISICLNYLGAAEAVERLNRIIHSIIIKSDGDSKIH